MPLWALRRKEPDPHKAWMAAGLCAVIALALVAAGGRARRRHPDARDGGKLCATVNLLSGECRP